MTPNDFCKKLVDIAPSIAKLLEEDGLSPPEAEEFRREFIPKKLTNHHRENQFPNYDIENIEISGVSFRNKRRRIPNGILIGNLEVDDLVVDDRSGEIVAIHDYTREVVFHCAIDFEHFLDGLIIIADSTWNLLIANKAEANKRAKEAADAAGGPKYFQFYLMLVDPE